jgi:hypothetical protein
MLQPSAAAEPGAAAAGRLVIIIGKLRSPCATPATVFLMLIVFGPRVFPRRWNAHVTLQTLRVGITGYIS